ncbi:MAG: hypothetical protein HFG83_00845 [Dorea sp.]|nr:hypothetical protein [Dorea sp.]
MDEKETRISQLTEKTGFILDGVKELPEMKAVLYQMHFRKNGAKLMWLSRREENKTFTITFKTLPPDDTGVFHILEHSLLCGSEKYPVSKPFVEMLKSSLQTFMNAFTFPDKTMYPVCSRNEKDFLNLMDVYLDAVFHPLCVTRKEIFLQEGWHYELDDPEGELTCNGVVYNEMKGMYASPDTLIDSLLNRMLFPDNCYRFQSGGDPEHITELSYEEYVANYRKFYHPSNACVILDGDMDIAAILTKIGKVFHEFEAQEMDCEINLQEPVHLEEYHCPYEVGGNEEIDNKVILAGGWVYGKYDEPEKNMACGVLADLLCSSNESPLRKAILEKGLAENVELAKMDGIQQPYFVLVVRNTSEDKRVEVWETVESALKELAEKGLDHNRLESILSRLEFNLREKESGMYPEGIVNAMRMLDSCLYGGDPAQNLCYGVIFDSLRKKIGEGYFEGLLKETLIENSHCARLALYPSKTIGEERRRKEKEHFQEIKKLWLPIKREQAVEELAWLRKIQGTPDAEEQLATLPMLTLSDIPEKTEEIPQTVRKMEGCKVLAHPLETDGIVHISYYFSLEGLSEEELCGTSFLRTLLGQAGTVNYNPLELQAELEGKLGRFQSYVDVFARRDQTEECTPYLVVQVSALREKMADAARLAGEVLNGSKFDDLQYIRTRIRQLRISMEQHILMNGNVYAARLALAGFSARGAAEETFQGIRMLRWVQRMDDDFEKEGARLLVELGRLCKKIFVRERATLSVTGEIEESWMSEMVCLLGHRQEQYAKDVLAEGDCGVAIRMGIRIPAEIGFAGKGANINLCGATYHGAMKVAARMLSYGYLWESIRMKGGAYGAGLTVSGNGDVAFTSFRDPNAANSLEIFDKAGAALRAICESNEPLDRYIVSTIASIEPLLSVRQKGIRATQDYLGGVTWEMICRERSEILCTTKEDLMRVIYVLNQVCEKGGVCVIGGKSSLDAVSTILEQQQEL